MAIEMNEQDGGRVLSVRVAGRVGRDDYRRFMPEIDRLIAEHGKIRILFEMHDFHGWTAGAVWEDIKFDLKHFRHIERVAVIGEKKWQKALAVFCRPFTLARVRYFDQSQVQQGREWLQEEPAAVRKAG